MLQTAEALRCRDGLASAARNGTEPAWETAGKARDSYHSTAVYPDDSLPVAIPRCLICRFRGRMCLDFKTLCMEDV